MMLIEGTLCGFIQAAMHLQKELLKAHEQVGNERTKADPCTHYNWNHNGLTFWLNQSNDN